MSLRQIKTNYKQINSDSKYTYMLNITSNWVYRKMHNQSDSKLKAYMPHDNFITHDEIVVESKKFN